MKQGGCDYKIADDETQQKIELNSDKIHGACFQDKTHEKYTEFTAKDGNRKKVEKPMERV